MNPLEVVLVPTPMRIKRKCQLLLFLLFPLCYQAQSGLEVNVSGISGFQGEQLQLWGTDIENYSAYGYRGYVAYTYMFSGINTEAIFGAGGKRLHSSGTSVDGDFEGITSKILFVLGGRYWFLERFSGGLYMTAENNRDFAEMHIATTDNFRYSMEAEALYRVLPWIGVGVSFNRAFYPLSDPHLLHNPANQLQLSLNFEIL